MQPNFEIAKIISEQSVPFFDASNFWWGIGLILLSVAFSILSWPGMRSIFQPEQRSRAIILWIINAGIFILALVMLTRAFPRVSPALVLGILLIVFIAVAGGTAITKKATNESGSKDSKQGKK